MAFSGHLLLLGFRFRFRLQRAFPFPLAAQLVIHGSPSPLAY